MLFLKSTFILSLVAFGQALTAQERTDGAVDHGIAQQVLAPSSGNTNISLSTAGPRPFYMIAHRVLTVEGVKIALAHGANALEIDMTAWKKGWWADHDGTPTSAGDTARAMFEAIKQHRTVGRTVTFVWLDIKNPDWCDPADSNWKHCSITGLRDLAREILEPAGVRVLYGFYKVGRAYNLIRGDMNSMEAINLNGKAKDIKDEFVNNGPADKSKRVMSYGYYNLPFQFGNCREANFNTCTELRQAVESDAFGKVFGWTSAKGQAWYVDKLLGEAGIDGLIYGLKVTAYNNDADARAAFADIWKWLWEHKDRRYPAGQNDNPW
ncbi:hypothetical protein M408DRAFT_62247 [Serendipita vermifera MAFF 305830]|uniref:Phospholipase D n=1 Tax=Serendipita vermifera MAFF 305830 TaxID=933852 RepID=A0A0C2XUS1_SERVB|nr:hypothetical protein M408DRAFT_62247 [Serendipita vermifera MAFF 305830]